MGKQFASKSALLSAVFVFAAVLNGQTSQNPGYSQDSIVNSATQTVVDLAPNALATIYGTNLAYDTASATVGGLQGSTLPTTLAGVTVYVYGLAANLFYVSPTQINFLIPYNLTAGTVPVVVSRQGVAGPSVSLNLASTSPGFFAWNGGSATGSYALATHLDGSLVSTTSPVTAGELIIIYAAGLGKVSPDTTAGRLAAGAAVIKLASQMQILLAGVALPAKSILYAGLAPGYAGLYQINLTLPAPLPANPEIRISLGAQVSPAQIMLPTGLPRTVAAN